MSAAVLPRVAPPAPDAGVEKPVLVARPTYAIAASPQGLTVIVSALPISAR